MTDDNTAHVGAMVKAERHVRIRDIVQELDISFGSAFNIIHECLGYRKVSCQWVPKQLDDVMKGKRIICNDMLRRVTVSSIALLLAMKHGYCITCRIENSRVWCGNICSLLLEINSVLRHMFTK